MAPFAFLAIAFALLGFAKAEESSGEACYVLSTHAIYCAVNETTCTAGNPETGMPSFIHLDEGYLYDGCCVCCNGCNHTLETGSDCGTYYVDGECGHEGGPSEDSIFYEGETSSNSTDGSGDSNSTSTNTTSDIGAGDNAGSCYSVSDHSVYCAVDQTTCESGNTEDSYLYAWYEPGYISTAVQSDGYGCCHCCGGCNHTAEYGTNCSTHYYPDGECGHDGGPSEDSPYYESTTATPSSAVRNTMSAAFLFLSAVLLL
mmetsp:Transcript_22797/g.36816  ORF Transcript_22797/g.36816 Transcript_22797/m.36816 type:complete len:258 (+) Transcript_22797:97-870(+)|eukprot:CAMPEP_0171527054 /NCGR_PEP_ID=MMETSP0959-20130129/10804_1 /TAXON_ID=87120 /ORGANISM="Aurantiochytrium limacinum, Strain ATCCMYA-1381" /LENGTH=257 /DNA_ID=CAMNT_0012068683 /DNA_START=86 /DNA_END=859 /DNA_ORIENTATION=-